MTEGPRISVVIPAHNAAGTIAETIAGIGRQSLRPLETVVVDDGSSDATAQAAAEAAAADPRLSVRVVRTERHGAAAARNRGARLAEGELVLFLGADQLPHANLVQRHASFHAGAARKAAASVGFVTWDPALPPTPLMAWLENGGGQNAFGAIAGAGSVDPRSFFYGSNLCIRKKVFTDLGGFNEKDFPEYGWEDLELGFRYGRAGYELRYEPDAMTFHRHRISLDDMRIRSYRTGKGFAVMARLYGEEIGPVAAAAEKRYWTRKILFNPAVAELLRLIAAAVEKRIVMPRLYRRVESLGFYEGLHGALAPRK